MARTRNLFLAGLLFFVFACETPRQGLDQIFPGAALEKGWSWHGLPVHYQPENLYDYINGEAELYLSYGFKELATLTYFWGDPEDTSIVVDIYDMGDRLNAFGLYSNYTFPEYNYEDMGVEVIVSDYGIKFFKDRYVVEIQSSGVSPKLDNAMRIVARRTVKRIFEPPDQPNLFVLLPPEGRIDKTERYKAQEMLNQDFLPGGFEAKYRILGEEGVGFVILFENEQTALEGLEKLKLFYRRNKKLISLNAIQDTQGFGVKTDYHDLLFVTATGPYLIGSQDFQSTQKGLELLKRFQITVKKI
jgi:hypothetical protein